jgi:membrane-bound ClpP family serine protease
MNPIPYAASILWGVVTALGLWLLVIPLSLGEMGGPTNWAVTSLVVAGLMLAVATYTARAKGTLAGVSSRAITFAESFIIRARADARPP